MMHLAPLGESDIVHLKHKEAKLEDTIYYCELASESLFPNMCYWDSVMGVLWTWVC